MSASPARVFPGPPSLLVLLAACEGSFFGGDGDADADGDADEPPPAASYESTIAEMGVPYDVRESMAGPDSHAAIYGEVPRIVGRANPNDTIDVAWTDVEGRGTFVTHIARRDGVWGAVWHLDVPMLDRLGGFTRDEEGNFYTVTAVAETLQHETEPSGLHRDDVLQLIRLDTDGTEAWRVDLRTDAVNPEATPIYDPLNAGTGRLAYGNGQLVAGFAQHGEYDPGVSSRHQWCTYLTTDAATGEVTTMAGGISHCFDQRLFFDGTEFVSAALGDASLRGIGIAKINTSGFGVVLAIKGGDRTTGGGYNNTFTRLGDVVRGDAGYAQVFATENDPTSVGGVVIASRNVAFVHIVPDFETVAPPARYDVAIVDTGTENPNAVDFDVQILDYWGNAYDGRNKQIAWLTDYADLSTENAERPKLVRVGEDRYVVLWEKWTLSTYVETFGTVVDEYGNVLVEATSLGDARLHRGDDAFAVGRRAAWVVGERDVPQLVLYTVDADLTLERHEIP